MSRNISIKTYALAVLSFCLVFCAPLKAQLAGWDYQRVITVEERSGTTLTNEQVLIVMSTSDLISEGKMQNDGADIRISDDCDGLNLLDLYIEEGINTTETYIWVTVPTLPANVGDTLYLFYGNSTATPVSDFATVFPNAIIVSSSVTYDANITTDWYEIQPNVVASFDLNTPDNKVVINAKRIKIDGSINSDEIGPQNGPGAGSTPLDTRSGGGGAYGGNGGAGGGNAGSAGGAAYGNISSVSIEPGSGGGGNGSDGFGGYGSSAISLNATRITQSMDQISMNGEPGLTALNGPGSGGGSGGGILLNGGYVEQNGRLSAAGAPGSGDTQTGVTLNAGGGGGGAGGRIKLIYDFGFDTSMSTFNVSGAGSTGTNPGATGQDGTYFLGQVDGPWPKVEVSSEIAISNPMLESLVPESETGPICKPAADSVVLLAPSGFVAYDFELNGTSVQSGASRRYAFLPVDGELSNFVVTLSNGGACDLTIDTSVITYPEIFADINGGDSVFTCGGRELDLNANPTGGTSPLTHEWTDTSTFLNQLDVASPSNVVPIAGIFELTYMVTDNVGCQAFDTIVVVADTGFRVKILPVGGPFCSNEPIFIIPTDEPGGIFNGPGIQDTTVGDFNAAIAGQGTHRIFYYNPKNSAQCATTDSVDIQIDPFLNPSIDIRSDVIEACPDSVINFDTVFIRDGGDLFELQWFVNNNPVIGASDVTFSPTNLNDQDQVMLRLVSSERCAFPDTVFSKFISVTIEEPKPIIRISQSHEKICDGQIVKFTAEGFEAGDNPQYQWQVNGAIVDGEDSTVYEDTFNIGDIIVGILTSDHPCPNPKIVTSNPITLEEGPLEAVIEYPELICIDLEPFNIKAFAPGGTWSGPGIIDSVKGTFDPGLTGDGIFEIFYELIDSRGCDAFDSIELVVPPQLHADAGVDQRACTRVTDFQIGNAPVGLGGIPPYTYEWEPANLVDNPTSPTPTALADETTNFKLIVTDSFNCKAIDFVLITVEEPIEFQPMADLAMCEGEDVELGTDLSITNGTAPFSYSWSPGNDLTSTNTVRTTTTTDETITYTLTITDDISCFAFDTVTVEVHSLPQANAGQNQSYCQAAPSVLGSDPTVTFGTAPFMYDWQPADGLDFNNVERPNATPINTVTYSLQVTDANGCISTDEVIITVADSLEVSIGKSISICFDETVELGGNPTVKQGTEPFIYSWEPAEFLASPFISNPSAQLQNSTVFTVTVNDGAGCISKDSIEVFVNPEIIAEAGNPIQAVCDGEPTRIGGNPTASGGFGSGGFNYIWKPASGLTNPNIPNPSAKPNKPTEYTLTVIDIEGCRAEDIVRVVLGTSPTADAGEEAETCSGKEIQLGGVNTGTGGNPPYSYMWLPNDGSLNARNVANPVATPDVSTTYVVTVIDEDGCTDEQSVFIEVNQSPVASAGRDKQICEGESITLGGRPTIEGGTPPYEVTWLPNLPFNQAKEENPEVVPEQDINYTVIVEDGNGCDDNDQVFIEVYPSPNAAFDYEFDDLTIKITDRSIGTDGVRYDFGDGSPLSFQRNPSYTFGIAGIYTICQYGLNVEGCTDTLCYTIYPEDFVGIRTVEEIADPISLFPNPVVDLLNIDLGGWSGSNCTIEVFNLSGTLVHRMDSQMPSERIQINVRDWTKGTYLISVVSEGKIRTQLFELLEH